MAKNNEMDIKNLEQANGGIFIESNPDMSIDLDEFLAMTESDMLLARKPLHPGLHITPPFRKQRPGPLA